ncbi:MAG: DUF2095 family protein [Candidatus Hadarchaeales archaeon]
MEIDIEEFKRKFPNLAREILGSQGYRISSVRSSIEEGEKTAIGERPNLIDFLRRCDTDEQALEIINYFEKKGEISEEYAARLRAQLVKEGVRSFGSKLERNWFLREKT